MIAAVLMTAIFAASSLLIAGYAKGLGEHFLGAGLAGYVIGGAIYSYLLKGSDLGVLGPATSIGGMLITILAGRFFLGEAPYSSTQWLGFSFGALSIVLITLGAAK